MFRLQAGVGVFRVVAHWFSLSINRRILAATFTIGALTFVVKGLALGKDLAIAFWFGAGDAVDAFLIALVLPSFALTVAATSLNAAFVPVFVSVRERRGKDAAGRLFQSSVVISFVLLTSITMVLALVFPWLMPYLTAGFSPEKAQQTHTLFLWMLPAVLFSGLATLYTGVLNAQENFALGAVAPAMVSGAVLIGVMFLGSSLGILSVALGTSAGYIVYALLMARAVSADGLSLRPHWYGWTPELRTVVAQYLPVAAGACLMSSTVVVDQAMAAALPTGSVAALGYGNKVVSLMTGIGAAALGAAVLPHFARMVANREWVALRYTLRTWVRIILLATVPLVIGLVYFSVPLVRLAFERGAFNSHDTALVGSVQAMYLLQIPFYTLGILFVRTLSSLQRNRTLLWGTVISVLLNIVMNLTLMKWLGVAGIALSTSLVYVVSSLYLGLMLHRALRTCEGATPVPSREIGRDTDLTCLEVEA